VEFDTANHAPYMENIWKQIKNRKMSQSNGNLHCARGHCGSSSSLIRKLTEM